MKNAKVRRFLKWGYYTLYADIIRDYRHVMAGLDDTLQQFLTPQEFSDANYVDKITKDIRRTYWRTFATPQEYFLCGFPSLSMKERKTFVTDRFLWRNLWKPDKYGIWGGVNLLKMRTICWTNLPFVNG